NMFKKIAIAWLFAIACGSIWIIYQLPITTKLLAASPRADSQPVHLPPTCDSADTIVTIKDMALQKLHAGGSYLSGGYNVGALENFSLSLDSFRRRGVFGETGLSCAALIKVDTKVKTGYSSPTGDHFVFIVSAEYTIEPTTDGKTIVSARFSPS